ncbi:MAG: hypothetical protein ACP6IY_09685, partial [Promethearchaeia archaeon]
MKFNKKYILILGILFLLLINVNFISAIFIGDGSDGNFIFTTTTKSYGNLINNTDYKEAGDILYLKVDRIYNFINFTLGNNTELRAWNPSTTGTSLYIKVNDTSNISGIVYANFEYAYTPTRGTYVSTSWNSGTSDGIITTPSVANGG